MHERRRGGLSDGPFRVTAISRPEPPLECELVTARAVPAGTLELELCLRGTGTLELAFLGAPEPSELSAVILDADGVPAGSAPNPGRWMERRGWEREETAEGERIRGLEPGVYWLDVADLERSRAARRRVEVREGETERVELALVPATWLEVTALHDDRPVPFALVIRADDGYLDRVGFTSDVRVQGDDSESELLPPGSYHLELFSGGRRATVDVTLAGEPRRELRVPLE